MVEIIGVSARIQAFKTDSTLGIFRLILGLVFMSQWFGRMVALLATLHHQSLTRFCVTPAFYSS